MKILVMAGGRGLRMGGVEKPMIEVCGEKIIDRVLGAVRGLGRVYVAVSPNTPATRDYVCRAYRGEVECIETSGRGYVEDLREALEKTGLPVLVLPADTPFIDRGFIEWFYREASERRGDVVTLVVCREGLCGPIGVSLFRAPGGLWEDVVVGYREALIDIDTPGDLERALSLCGSTGGGGGY